MYIQVSGPAAGSFTSNDFENQEKFLDSLSNDAEFKIYETDNEADVKKETDKVSFKKVIKKLRIQTVEPINKGKSFYLSFTATDADKSQDSYKGMICWK